MMHLLRPSGIGWAVLPWLCACAGVAEFAEIDLSDAGWTVWTGQAVWTTREDRPALAGELLAARHTRGDVLVSFTKPPLSIFTARSNADTWRLDFVERGRHYAGRGRPPSRFVWFALPSILDGGAPPAGWRVERPADDELVLAHHGGERIRLVIDR